MNQSKQVTSRPILVWEKRQSVNGKEATAGDVHEATVTDVHTGGESSVNMPVIRIVSSGFGNSQVIKRSSSTVNQLRCAA